MTAFRYYLRVRYQECDSQHVVFNARYGDYVDLAMAEFLRAVMPARNPFDGSFELHVVRQVTEWRRPARYNDVLEIGVRTTRTGTTSFTVAMEMRRAGEHQVLVRCESVYVAVDGQTWAKRPLAAAEKRLLAAGAPGVVVDHAGYLMGRREPPS